METAELRLVFNRKKEKINKKGDIVAGFSNTSFEMFQKWHDPLIFAKGCYYCGLTNEQSAILFNLRYNATRGGKRGRRLELDRLDPFLPYDHLTNLRWCCYWCNNAKTNFFTEKEFLPIAKEIGNVLRMILTEKVTEHE